MGIVKILALTIVLLGTTASIFLRGNVKDNAARIANEATALGVITDRGGEDSLPGNTKKIFLATVKSVKVLSLDKEIMNDSSGEEYNQCKAWSLTAKQIEFIIREFDSMTSEEQYLSFLFYPCRIKGEIEIDSKKCKYWMGAGGTLTLKVSNATLYFGYFGKRWRKYFISGRLGDGEISR